MKKLVFHIIRFALLIIVLITFINFLYPEYVRPFEYTYLQETEYKNLDTCQSIQQLKGQIDSGKIKRIIMPYVGSMEGGMEEDWLRQVETRYIQFHIDNRIPATFSIYAKDLEGSRQFDIVFMKIYESNCLEILQKGTNIPSADMYLIDMPYSVQKDRITAGRENMIAKLESLYPLRDDLVPPSSFNTIEGKVNKNTIRILDELGFLNYFELFKEEEVDIFKEPSEDTDVYQYGVSFTVLGLPGPEAPLKTNEDMMKEIIEVGEDPRLKYLDDILIVPIYLENWDIEGWNEETRLGTGSVNETKWDMYMSMLLELQSMDDTVIVTPEMLYELKRL